jgi:DNA invertase Pin-like site-specific DNA recombinase
MYRKNHEKGAFFEMIYGYARVSTYDQNFGPQLKMLKENGCESKNIFKEKKTGKNAERDELNKLLDLLEKGDKIIITKVDRMARNLKDGLMIVEKIREKGASIHILNMGLIDDSPIGDLILNILLAVAEFELGNNKERQREGIAIAKAKGIYKGSSTKYTERHDGLMHALELYAEGSKTVKQISEITKISRATIYRKAKEFEISR